MADIKEQCAVIMAEFFGPASAAIVRNMRDSDANIIAYCRQKALALMGEERAKRFDSLS